MAKKKRRSGGGPSGVRKIVLNPFSTKRAAATPKLIKHRAISTTPDPNKTLGISDLNASQVSTPVTTRSLSRRGNGNIPEDITPLRPKMIIRPYQSQGFLEPPVTIDETLEDIDVVDLSQVEEEPKTIEVTAGNSEKKKENKTIDLCEEEKTVAVEASREEGEIREDCSVTFDSDGNPLFVLDQTGNPDNVRPGPSGATVTVPQSPEVLIVSEITRTRRRSARFADKKNKKSLKDMIFRKDKKGKKKGKKEAGRREPPPPSPATIVAKQRRGFQFDPNVKVTTDFTSGVSSVHGGVFNFTGSKRLVPTMGVRQLSHSSAMGNVYMPGGEAARNRGELRPIVIDGSNVAMEHGNSLGMQSTFSCRGIDICVEYFKRRGHKEVTVFIPQFRLKVGMALDQNILDRLRKTGNLVLTPSRTLPGKGSYAAYDDRYIVQFAAVKKAVIVSNDNYRDLLSESADMREAIERRLLMFNFAPGDMLMFPQDPLGRNGPRLEDFLRF